MYDKKEVVIKPNLEVKLDELYKELGKAYYEGDFEDPLPQLLPIFDEITSTKKEIENNMKYICPYIALFSTVYCIYNA